MSAKSVLLFLNCYSVILVILLSDFKSIKSNRTNTTTAEQTSTTMAASTDLSEAASFFEFGDNPTTEPMPQTTTHTESLPTTTTPEANIARTGAISGASVDEESRAGDEVGESTPSDIMEQLPTIPSASTAQPMPGKELEASDSVLMTSTTTPVATTETASITTDRDPTTTITTTTTTTATPATTTKAPPNQCINLNFCLNGGTCIINELGQMACLCPAEFYGARCQIRNICRAIIADSLTGEEICANIGRECDIRNDKFFRCSCHEDEYFVFKTLPQKETQKRAQTGGSSSGQKYNLLDETAIFDAKNHKLFQAGKLHRAERPLRPGESPTAANMHIRGPTKFLYDNLVADNPTSAYQFADSHTRADGSAFNVDDESGELVEKAASKPNFIAECRKVGRCVGVRCKQLSEKCTNGTCVCNNDLGYMKDRSDGLCKLLDPCLIARQDERPVCGQANCIATYDRDLFKCVCPVGYRAVKVGSDKSTIQCVLLTNLICDVPLLNKCQHVCQVDKNSNSYRCSCLPGYRPGRRAGVDDHMCFFEEQIDTYDYEEEFQSDEDSDLRLHWSAQRATRSAPSYVFKRFMAANDYSAATGSQRPNYPETITYEPLSKEDGVSASAQLDQHYLDPSDQHDSAQSLHRLNLSNYIIRRMSEAEAASDAGTYKGHRTGASRQSSESDSYSGASSSSLSSMSAQDRCNMYCEENKICVLESGSRDSYRCACDRQGYVSIGDRCLDWCAAAEFSYSVRSHLESVCYSGLCKPMPQRVDNQTLLRLERKSSWRPTFECDCSTSSLIFKDPATNLCKLNFSRVLEPCLPGNEGYVDCVENKNAYCAVLHRPLVSFTKDLQRDRPNDPNLASDPLAASGSSSANDDAKGKSKMKDKLYTCVCSPEKKFLVDKPRNKARCVDECDLLSIECGRFNRMCRAAAIGADDYGPRSLIRADPDGIRMNFKRTGCECLPGFNVGPSESLDFTLDDNYPTVVPSPFNLDALFSSISDGIIQADITSPDSDHLRAKYMNINSRCSLDYDVVEFHASFKAPANFEPAWVKVRNPILIPPEQLTQVSSNDALNKGSDSHVGAFLHEGERLAHMSAFGRRSQRPTMKANLDGDSDQLALDPMLGSTAAQTLEPPDFMRMDVSELPRNVVFVARCDPSFTPLSLEAYQECIKYRYWILQKLRSHFADWRQVMTEHLRETFQYMDGNIKLRVNHCESTIKNLSRVSSENQTTDQITSYDPLDPSLIVDADVDCELTLHAESDGQSPRYAQKVLLEKQLQKFIYDTPDPDYYLMAPNMLIGRESVDNLAEHRKLFNPCKSSYEYCDRQTKCEMVDTVNFTCTCDYGYTPIGSRDLYYGDSRKEVCEDINECLFDVCKELENVSTCINEIGDYRCQCNRHYTGDNKRYCTHVCNTILCKHGKCKLVDDHHAFCECDEGYKEADCSVQDPRVALRKANMIIIGSIFASILLLAVTLAISMNSQLKKTKKKLKRLEAATGATAQLFDLTHQPLRARVGKIN